jgi:hypothetical protein
MDNHEAIDGMFTTQYKQKDVEKTQGKTKKTKRVY